MLDANSGLGWRDVQNILAYSARGTGSSVGASQRVFEEHNWIYNGAENWNGGGLHFSEDYGFGAVDAYNAVRMAEVWKLFSGEAQASPNELSYSQSTTLSAPLEANRTTEIQFTFGGAAFDVEFVDVSLSLTHEVLSDLAFALISPDGTNICSPISAARSQQARQAANGMPNSVSTHSGAKTQVAYGH